MAFKLIKQSFDKGDYSFSGKRLTTFNINITLTQEEIEDIHQQLQDYIKVKGGSVENYQIFENECGLRVYAIDNMSNSTLEELKHEGHEKFMTAQNYYKLSLDIGSMK